MSHRGDGACDLPHQPPRRLDFVLRDCRVHRVSLLPFLDRGSIPEEQWAQLCSIIESYFDLEGDCSPDKYKAVCAVVNFLVADRYRDYKLKAHNHLKENGSSHPYGELSVEE
ncbi:hypothetical protein Adt_33996 [Abeliophyllum distichum]|uniref:Uncharacterized protein n=1 Tax=Abeliophyllum distichum TaxID=126358 RepID=A0ABD1QXW2_9LAMI